jgi:hypothetical protein
MKDLLDIHRNMNGGPRRTYCLSCGTTVNIGRRKYCSPACRRRLLYKLDMRTGLIQALNIRYATFYFSELMIVMDMLPYGTSEIFSFFYPRSPGRVPAEDFSDMADTLGNSWWAEKRRTNKRYLASRFVLDQAVRNAIRESGVKPLSKHTPNFKGTSLACLNIDRSELDSPELGQIIKNAYRRQAKRHHPDLGGNAETFRRIHQAYEDLLFWSRNPTFRRRRGFPDKWLYDGATNRWIQPIAV